MEWHFFSIYRFKNSLRLNEIFQMRSQLKFVFLCEQFSYDNLSYYCVDFLTNLFLLLVHFHRRRRRRCRRRRWCCSERFSVLMWVHTCFVLFVFHEIFQYFLIFYRFVRLSIGPNNSFLVYRLFINADCDCNQMSWATKIPRQFLTFDMRKSIAIDKWQHKYILFLLLLWKPRAYACTYINIHWWHLA